MERVERDFLMTSCIILSRPIRYWYFLLNPTGKPKTKLLTLRLPDTLVYRPDYFLKADSVWQVSWCKIRAWLIDEATWFKDHIDDIYAR